MEHGPKFYDPAAETLIGTNRLPHWDQRGSTYFLTFRLADSVPTHLLKKRSEEELIWMQIHPKPWDEKTEQEYHSRFSSQLEAWLDQGMGSCLLRNPSHARLVEETLHFHHGARHLLHAWIIMPNHVHVLAETLGEQTLPLMLKSWKGYTAKQINEAEGRTGPLWQRSYFDRLVRGWEHFGNCVRYIRKNPIKAGLKEGEYLIGESELAGRF